MSDFPPPPHQPTQPQQLAREDDRGDRYVKSHSEVHAHPAELPAQADAPPRRDSSEPHSKFPALPLQAVPHPPAGVVPDTPPAETRPASEGPESPGASPRVIANHAEFLAAIRDRKLIRILFHAQPHHGTVDRECAPLDYGPDLWSAGNIPLYWIGHDSSTPESVPLGLSARQIINVHVLDKTFDPTKVRAPSRPWYVLRDWGNAGAVRSDPVRPGVGSSASQHHSAGGPNPA